MPTLSSPSVRRTGRSATWEISPGGCQLAQEGLVALVEGGACDGLGSGAAPVASQKSRAHAGKIASPKRRDLLWELGLANRPVSVPGTRGAAKQLTLSLDPTAATPELRDLTRWEQMAADYRRTGLSVGVHPLTLLRPHLPEGTSQR